MLQMQAPSQMAGCQGHFLMLLTPALAHSFGSRGCAKGCYRVHHTGDALLLHKLCPLACKLVSRLLVCASSMHVSMDHSTAASYVSGCAPA